LVLAGRFLRHAYPPQADDTMLFDIAPDGPAHAQTKERERRFQFRL